MDENNKVQLTEIYDVTDTNKFADLSSSDVSSDRKLQFDEWDEPTWLSQHTITDGMTIHYYSEFNDKLIKKKKLKISIQTFHVILFYNLCNFSFK